jgi:L-threonylcarbamoyladenylate synthase
MSGKIRCVDARFPAPETIREAASVIAGGGVILFPTHGLYGLGADAKNLVAVQRVFAIKHRPVNHPLLVIVDDPSAVFPLAREVSAGARRLMNRLWPGGLTLVFAARQDVSVLLTGATGKIGVRQAGHPVARALVKAVGGPITATSANLSGTPACFRISDLDMTLIEEVDRVLDAGALAGGPGSTVVDVTASRPEILREGFVTAQAVFDAWQE